MRSILICLALAVGALAQTGNIIEVAEKLGATDLVKFIKDVGLESTLEGKGPFTVFAPTNEAFKMIPQPVINKLKNNKTAVTDLLEYHVLSGVVKSTDLKNELTAPTLFAKHSIRVNIYDQDKGKIITVNGSPVTLADQMASNGIIHVLAKVLYPIPEGTVTDLVASTKDLSTLLTAVQKANLGATLAGPGPYTVFAPTDSAFQRLPPGTLNKLLANVTALTDVLEYHVVKGTFYSDGLQKEQDVPSLEGKTLHIVRQGITNVMVNNAKVVMPNNPVDNGVVHVIDSVLIPPTMEHLLH